MTHPRGPRVCFSYSSRKHFRGPSQVPVPAEGPAPPPPGRPLSFPSLGAAGHPSRVMLPRRASVALTFRRSCSF